MVSIEIFDRNNSTVFAILVYLLLHCKKTGLMDLTLPEDSSAEVVKGMSDISIGSSILSSAGGSESLATVAPQASEVKKKEPTAVVDINGLSDQEVIHLLQEKERKRQLERYARQAAKGQDLDREHKFWSTQPVPGLKDTFEGESGPMELNTDVTLVKQEPYNMPAGFEWCSLDVTDPAVILEVYTLLFENYVEDDDCLFRFDYSIPFLQWALTPPGFLKEWHVGVRNSKTGKPLKYLSRLLLLLYCICLSSLDFSPCRPIDIFLRNQQSTHYLVYFHFVIVHLN